MLESSIGRQGLVLFEIKRSVNIKQHINRERCEQMESWIIPYNPKYYDVLGAFDKFHKINWKQSLKAISPGDIVYVYVGKPYSAIMFKCRVNKVNLTAVEIDDHEFVIDGTNYLNYGNYMELELLERFSKAQITLSALQDSGMEGNIQGPRRTDISVQLFLDKIKGEPISK